MLQKTLESPLDCKEIKPVNPKGNQSWIFIARTNAEAEAPVLWPPDATSWLLRKDPDAGKDWRWEEKVSTKDEMVGRHHWLDEFEFEQALGIVHGQRGLTGCSPWGHKELNTTEGLNWNLKLKTDGEKLRQEIDGAQAEQLEFVSQGCKLQNSRSGWGAKPCPEKRPHIPHSQSQGDHPNYICAESFFGGQKVRGITS